ncbi:MAG: hypothetical protein ACK4RX_13690 [Chitinophagaceae bacterium]
MSVSFYLFSSMHDSTPTLWFAPCAGRMHALVIIRKDNKVLGVCF